MPKQPKRGDARRPQAGASPPEVVDPAWLLKAFAVMVLVALLCGYATLCWMFHRGQWQLVLHPSKTTAAPATVGDVAYQQVRFGAGATGVPELTGWWIPAGTGSEFGPLTILYLRGGDGSLADDQAMLASLHEVGATVFAIDYRGYGQSVEFRPNEGSMREDAESAWAYLRGSRGLRSERIIPYGRGVGAALALGLAMKTSASAVVLDQPDFHVMDRVMRDPRSRLVPVRLLFHDRFALLPALDEARTPKLILSRGEVESAAVLRAHDPKMTVALPGADGAEYVAAVRRFLGQYAAPTPVPATLPSPTP